MKEYDFSAFNAGVEESRKSSSESGERMLPSQEPDTLDDFLTGAAQGSTFGFSDEIGAAIDVLRGRAPADAKTLMDAFRVLQKAREAEIEKAKERSPYAALAGELIGGFAVPIPGALAAGAGRVLKITPALQKLGVGEKLAEHIGTGAAVGGLAGLGTSKGAIEESPSELLKDIGVSGLTGGAIGGVLGKALDKVIATKEAVKKYPSIQKGLAAMEGAEGKTKGMEGKQILTEEVPTILPGEEPTGAQQFLNLAQKEISSEAERAVEIQRQAKDNLNKAISDNLNRTSIPENAPESLIKTINEDIPQMAYSKAIEQFYENYLPPNIKEHLRKKMEDGEKIYVNNFLSNYLDPKLNKKASDLFGDVKNTVSNEMVLDAFRVAAKESKDPTFSTYAENLEKLMKIANARDFEDPRGVNDKTLIPIRKALEKIDPNFILKIKQDPTKLTIGDLYNFRQNFLQRAKDKALDLDLDFAQREILFGKRNPDTGKYDGGVFDAIENVMKSSSKDLKSFINNVDEKSRHIEALLNEHPDPNFHGLKAWDFKNNKDLKLELYNILSDKLTSSKAGSVQSYEAANILKNYFETMLAGETDPVKRKAIEESAKLLDERSKMLASITERAGIDRVSGDSVSAYDPTKMLQHGKESSVPKLFETLGRMKKSVGEDIEEIPSVARKAISAPFTAPFKFKSATEEQLKKAAELLKSSKNASVRQFGEGISESATNSPAVRNAIIHSAFQRADIREALGLSLNDDDKEKK